MNIANTILFKIATHFEASVSVGYIPVISVEQYDTHIVAIKGIVVA